jgi:hypothetical protein
MFGMAKIAIRTPRPRSPRAATISPTLTRSAVTVAAKSLSSVDVRVGVALFMSTFGSA